MKNLIKHSKDFLRKLVKGVALLAILFYRLFLSPFFGGSCRYNPSCSIYAEQAFRTHSPLSAFYLTLKRVGSCHPYGGCGDDPVPNIKREEARYGG